MSKNNTEHTFNPIILNKEGFEYHTQVLAPCHYRKLIGKPKWREDVGNLRGRFLCHLELPEYALCMN